MRLFQVGDRVESSERDSAMAKYVGEVVEVNVTRTPPHRGRPTYKVYWWERDGERGVVNSRDVIGMEQFEIQPLGGWDVPPSRKVVAAVNGWLVS